MNKLRKRKSQVSSDFDVTLKAVVKTVIHSETDLNHSNEDVTLDEDFYTYSDLQKKPIGESLKDNKLKFSFGKKSSFSRKISNDDKMNLYSVTGQIRESISNKHSSENGKFVLENMLEGRISSSSKSTSSNERNWRITYFIRKLFSNESTYCRPFESTSIDTLPFGVSIVMENKTQFYISVIRYYTVETTIQNIAKKKSLMHQEISLYYKNCRLERNVTLLSYGIKSRSHIYVKILKKIKIYGNSLTKTFAILIYTSEKVKEIKTLFSTKIQTDPDSIELKYNEVILQSHKDIFVYGIKEGSVIDIFAFINEKSRKYSSESNILGVEVAERYIRMTNALETCDCKEKRLNAITCIIFSVIDKRYKSNETTHLSEFGSNLHHMSCFKFNTKSPSYSTVSDISQSNDSEISIEECIFAEIDRTEKNKKVIIEESDLDFLSNAETFKEFKHFLKHKIGTECNLRSVAMLYKFGMQLVLYTGAEEDNPIVKRILHFITLYFQKYYERDIINNGGMGALTLTASDIED